jgi:hypothetical protein
MGRAGSENFDRSPVDKSKLGPLLGDVLILRNRFSKNLPTCKILIHEKTYKIPLKNITGLIVSKILDYHEQLICIFIKVGNFY